MAAHSMQYCIALCALLAVASAFTPYGTCDNFAAESENEGFCYHRYKDSVGLWTIGLGFNMQQSGALGIMAKCFNGSTSAAQAALNAFNQGPDSCNYQGVTSQVMSKELAACLLYVELVEEETCVKGVLGSQFTTVPRQVVSGMIDMAYNMGCGGLKSFGTMIGHIKSGDYTSAASAARSTKWCGQVHGRCDRTTACINNHGGSSTGSPPPPPPPPATGSTPRAQGSGSQSPPSGGCFTFQPGLCPGADSCMCTLGLSCGKASAQSVHNATDVFEAKRRELDAQGVAGSCAALGGTCYKVITGNCPGSTNCLQAGDRC